MEIKFKYKHLRTYTPGRIPLPSQILEGQFAINIPDKKIYTKDSSGNIIDLTDYVPTDIIDSQYVKQGVLPLTQIGNIGGIQALPITSWSSTSIFCNTDIPILLSGRNYIFDSSVINVPSGIIANGVPILCYFELISSNIQMIFSLTPLVESVGRVYIGKIIPNGTGFDMDLKTVTRIDLYRLSEENVGSSIPVTQGDPSRRGYFDPSWGFIDEQ
jgi:hypothetical protein